MPKLRGPEGGSTAQLSRGERTSLVLSSAQKLGIAPLSDIDLGKGHALVANQLGNGIRNDGTPRLAAFRTRVNPVSPEAWSQVKVGDKAVIGAFGGTNLTTAIAEKQANGLVTVSGPIETRKYTTLADRKVTLQELADRIAEPLVATIERLDAKDRKKPVKYGLSVAWQHENTREDYGIEVHPVVEPGGVLSKGNRITDWDELFPEQRRIIKAVSGSVRRELPGVKIKTGVGINDTVGVALDAGAAQQATEAGYLVLPNGAVAGSGTNDSVKLEAGDNKFFRVVVPENEAGLINNEKGQAAWIDTPVSKRMRRLLIDNGDLELDQDRPRFEHELGQYLGYRLAAGVDLLAESGDLPVANRERLVDEIITATKEEPKLTDLIVTGNYTFEAADDTTNHVMKFLTQSLMERAAQLYGIFYATNAEPFQHLVDASPGASFAVPTEGSVMLKGRVDDSRMLRGETEKNMAKLGPKATIWKADGMAGVAGVTLADEFGRPAA